ncbi:MAG: glycoside hydrolase family 127 protein [Phycisphaerales bacterium]|nr:glycoside hydrolase family 127 protein [Phycisphaerales bacterium]
MCSHESIRPYPWGQVKIGGFIGGRIDSVIRNRIMRQDIAALVEPFITRQDDREWRGEFWGKWFLSLVDAWNYTHDESVKQKMEEALDALLKAQDEAGLITACLQQPGQWGQWDIWGRRYTLAGLLACYESTGDQRALRAAQRLADYTMEELARYDTSVVQIGKFLGMPSSTIIEPLVDLYHHTGEERYLDHAQSIVTDWRRYDAPRLVDKALDRIPVGDRNHAKITEENWWSRENGLKAYEMMACYEALCHLYRQTGQGEYLNAAVNAWQSIRDDEIMACGSGSAGECWYHGRRHQLEPLAKMMESCTAMLWIKLGLQILQLTNDPKVADEIERAFYNAYLHSMKPDGSWFCRHNPMSGIKEAGENQCGMEQNCCVANGPRIMMLWPRMCVMRGDEGPVINFYGQYQADVTLDEGIDLKLSMESDYPRSGDILLRVDPSRAARFVLRLRIPAWCESARVQVNGRPIEKVIAGTYLSIDRTWEPNDRIEISLGMNPRLLEETDQQKIVHQAVMYGPLLLARDKRLDAGRWDEPVRFIMANHGQIQMSPCSTSTHGRDIWGEWTVPVMCNDKQIDAHYCDYASAGNTWAADSQFQVWSRGERST